MEERTTRQALLIVARELLERLLPDWRTVALLRYGYAAEPFHKALKLPNTCQITGISAQLEFFADQITFRIESPEFVETRVGERLPEVKAVYQHSLDLRIGGEKVSCQGVLPLGFEPGLVEIEGIDGYFLCVLPLGFEPGLVEIEGIDGYFLCWEGPAVETKRTYGPHGGIIATFRTNPLPPSGEAEGGYFCPGAEDFAEELCAKSAILQRQLTKEVAPCWRCHNPTARRLLDGTAECQDCAAASLL